jgi:hypothetical protein
MDHGPALPENARERCGHDSGQDGGYERYLIIATAREAEKLLAECGEIAVLIKMTALRGGSAALKFADRDAGGA